MIPINDFVRIGKALTRIENENVTLNNENSLNSTLGQSKNFVIGVTGGPGVGKSTFINQLVKTALNEKFTVAVIAIDPTSQIDGGTFLGDRIRLNPSYPEKGVFIRSLSSNGSPDGIPRSVESMVKFLHDIGFEIIIIETVGVGQLESGIRKYANKVVVIPNNNEYDWIQVFKNESYLISDLFYINKQSLDNCIKISDSIKSFIDTKFEGKKLKPACIIGNAKDGESVEEVFFTLVGS